MNDALKEQENRYASAANFFKDRQDMLHERILEELDDQKINDRSRKAEMHRVSKILANNYKSKIEHMKDELGHIERHRLFLDGIHIRKSFEGMNRNVTRTAFEELKRISQARNAAATALEASVESSELDDEKTRAMGDRIEGTMDSAKVVASLTADRHE